MGEEWQYLPEYVPLFPLPEVVLFPRTILPLHIFEPRYREMTADALVGDRIIATALLQPGFEPLYYTHRAPIYPTIGVGEIVESEQVPDGNYNLLLRGLSRAKIIEELTDRPYRVARIEPVRTFCSRDQTASQKLRGELFNAIRNNPGLDARLRKMWLRLADLDLELDELSDLIAVAVPTEAELRQCLMDEPDAYLRTQMLVNQIRTLGAIARNYQRSTRPGGPSFN